VHKVVVMVDYKDQPWEHPDWYDLHDASWTAGPEREPEHYRELVLALPPLEEKDHLVDVGAGTGKVACLVARAYPGLGTVTLVEPNESKLERARTRVVEILPGANIRLLVSTLGEGRQLPRNEATVVTVGSVFMPVMERRGGTHAQGLAWLRASFKEVKDMLRLGACLYDLETLAPPWARGSDADPSRRLFLPELVDEFLRAGFRSVECVYRFRDRVILRAQA
jgi:SAM-dependent methyltransferase